MINTKTLLSTPLCNETLSFLEKKVIYFYTCDTISPTLYACTKKLARLFRQLNVFISVSIKCRLQTADCRLQIGYKMQTRYKMQTADCRLGIKCRLRPILGINCRLSERNVFNVPQCHAIAFPSLSAAKSFLLGAKRQH